MKSYGMTIQMKPLQQYFHKVLFIKYERSSKFWGCGRNPVVWTFKLNLFGSTFTAYYLLSM